MIFLFSDGQTLNTKGKEIAYFREWFSQAERLNPKGACMIYFCSVIIRRVKKLTNKIQLMVILVAFGYDHAHIMKAIV